MRGRRRLLVPALFLVAAFGGAAIGSASTNANTVPAGRLGQGSAATSPYSISNLAYTLDVNDPQYVSEVAFTISPASPRILKVRLYGGGSWYGCSNVSGNVACSTSSPAAPATSASTLTIVASQ